MIKLPELKKLKPGKGNGLSQHYSSITRGRTWTQLPDSRSFHLHPPASPLWMGSQSSLCLNICRDLSCAQNLTRSLAPQDTCFVGQNWFLGLLLSGSLVPHNLLLVQAIPSQASRDKPNPFTINTEDHYHVPCPLLLQSFPGWHGFQAFPIYVILPWTLFQFTKVPLKMCSWDWARCCFITRKGLIFILFQTLF